MDDKNAAVVEEHVKNMGVPEATGGNKEGSK